MRQDAEILKQNIEDEMMILKTFIRLSKYNRKDKK